MAKERVIIQFEVESGGAVKKIEQVTKELQGVSIVSTKSAAGMGAFSKGIAGAAAAFASFQLGGKMLELGKSIITTGADFEMLGKRLDVMGKKFNRTREELEDFGRELSRNAPYNFQQLTEAMLRLGNMGIDPMNGSMLAIMETTSALDQSMDTMNSIIIALGKSWNKGKLQAEEMNMMLERGVPVLEVLTKYYGVNAAALYKMAERGEIGKKAIKALWEELGKLNAGASENAMDTFVGKWSLLEDVILDIKKTLSEGGMLDAAKEGLDAIIGALNQLQKEGKFEDMGKDLGKLMGGMVENLPAIISAMTKLVNIFDELWAVVSAGTKIFTVYWAVLNAPMALGMLKIFKIMIVGLIRDVKVATVTLGSFTSILPGLAAALTAAYLAGKALGEWFDTWHRSLDDGLENQKEILAFYETLKEKYGSLAEAQKQTGLTAMDYYKNMKEASSNMEAQSEGFKKFWQEVQDKLKATKPVVQGLTDEFDDMAEANDKVAEALNKWLGDNRSYKQRIRDLIKEGKELGATVEQLAQKLYHESATAKDKNILTALGDWKNMERMNTQLDELKKKLIFPDALITEKLTDPIKKANEETEKLKISFSDLVSDVFMGELTSFGDLWNSIWNDMAKNMSAILGDEFGKVFGGGEGSGYFFSDLLKGFGKVVDKIKENPELSALTGIGGMYAASQGSGGWGGALMGAMSGGMAGLGIAAIPALGIAGPVGWIIAGVLALVGGIAGFMGGGDITPETEGYLNLNNGIGAISRVRDQEMPDAVRSAWIQDRMEEWKVAYQGMSEVLRIFNDPELFEMLNMAGMWNFNENTDANMVAELFRDQIIPDYLSKVFETAINKGLGDLGMSEDAIDKLWRELDIMGADRMVESLGNFVRALTGMADLIADMDWDAMLTEVGENSMDTFRSMIRQTLEAIDMMTIGMDKFYGIHWANSNQFSFSGGSIPILSAK